MTPKSPSLKPLAFVPLLLALTLLAVPLVAENITWVLRVSDGIPTKVDVSDKVLTIELTGRWTSTTEVIPFSDVDRSAVFVVRGEGADPAAWKALCGAAQGSLHKHVEIKVATTGAWSTRGGIPRFQMPPATVTITPRNP
jgi:hypothetical protein